MKFSTSLLTVLPAALAVPILVRDTTNNAFNLIASHSTAPVHLQPIQARNNSLWVAGPSGAYCPTGIEDLDCSQFSNATAFSATSGNPTYVGMDTEVPGGQSLYIAPGGAVKFTIAHSGYMPPGSVAQAFNYSAPPRPNYPGSFLPVANGSDGFFACPATPDEMNSGPWQVFANTPDAQYPCGDVQYCWGIGAVPFIYQGNGTAAWQYQ